MLNKYIYAEATQDYWPQIKSISANSFHHAVEKIIEKYSQQFDDFPEFDDFDEFREYLNNTYTIALSDIEDIEEI